MRLELEGVSGCAVEHVRGVTGVPHGTSSVATVLKVFETMLGRRGGGERRVWSLYR